MSKNELMIKINNQPIEIQNELTLIVNKYVRYADTPETCKIIDSELTDYITNYNYGKK